MELHAMPEKFTRRDVLNSAPGLVAATALGGLINNGAVASEELPGHAQEKLTHNQAFAPIDHMLQHAAESNTVAGVVALGATEKGVVYEGAFGKADTNAGSKISADTVFWLRSMTKAITATACMQLIERGKLQLDQPASQILPELKSPQVLDGFDSGGQPKLRPAKRPITVRQLLTHTSGFTYSVWSEALTQYEKVTGMPDIAYSRNGAFTAPLDFDPGDRWQYGIGMASAGKLVEAITDQSLEIYFLQNIFAPVVTSNT